MSENSPPPEDGPVIMRRSTRRAVPRITWLLLAIIAIFFVVGVLLVTSGLLGGNVDQSLPGPTAFTLTPGP